MPAPETVPQTRSAAQIRREFLEFFKQRDHAFAPSSPVVPHDDPTLLFTNAGMNQFKDVFLGQGTRPYNRAANSQKCIRAGGKHNDLEDVGKDTYHHTFFEMLGNWSFGDYFKKDAIQWAWELLTEVWGLDKSRLYVTVFAGDKDDGLEPDEEAAKLWAEMTDIDPSHISRWGKKDNFWEMGDSGPCGPCSEIHYDDTPDRSGGKLVNLGDPRVIEIWNLVFIQYNRDHRGKLTPLPAKHVDTGMGFERITRVLQGKTSNYDTDIWTPIFDAIREKTGAREYQGSMEDHIDIAYRVVADHIRCLTVAITDGAVPSNEGRGYVLRRILRRAVRHARQTLNVGGPVLCDLVPAVVASLGDAFPDLKKDPKRVAGVIRAEEEAFLRTIDRGLEYWWYAAGRAMLQQFEAENDGEFRKLAIGGLVDEDRFSNLNVQSRQFDIGPSTYVMVLERRKGEVELAHTYRLLDIGRSSVTELFADVPVISAADAFKLHDTYGFPIDLTQVMAEERGMTVDVAGFEKLMEQARERSRAGVEHEETFTLPPNALEELKREGVRPTDDQHTFDARPLSAKVMAIWNGTDFDNHARLGRRVAVILDRTNHYAESGGQVGDQGAIAHEYEAGFGRSDSHSAGRFIVEDTQSVGGYVLHIGHVTDGRLRIGERITATVDRKRRGPTRANHTATHLLNFALREVIGDGVEQKGSLVAPDRLRFDFSCAHAMKPAEIEQVERIVNDMIERDLPVHAEPMPLESAKSITGVRAVFGEKYPDPVRVVSIGPPTGELRKKPTDPKWREASIEFCGGTHLKRTGEAVDFVLTQESALAAGVRRVTALTGEAAQAAREAGRRLLDRIAQARALEGDALLREFDEIVPAVEQATTSAAIKQQLHDALEPLRETAREARKVHQAGAREQVVEQARRIAAEQSATKIIVAEINDADKDTLLAAMDVIRAKAPGSAVMLFTADREESKVAIVAAVPQELIQRGLKAGDWVREAAKTCGGGGGGRPDMAQAGGKDPARVRDAMNKARDFATAQLK